jgi:transmembrane sensor
MPPHDVLQAAAEWFALLRSGTAPARERAEWQRWLDGGEERRAAWRYIEAVSRRFEPIQAPSERRAAVAALRAVAGPGISRRRALAGFVLLAGGGLLGWGALHQGALLSADYRTAVGEIRAVELADGSHLWLNTATALNADYRPTLRRLQLLEGEVLIETASDARPFVVDTGFGRLRALGTRFSVRLGDGGALLSVTEGAVKIRTAGSGATRVIGAGEQVTFSSGAIGAPEPSAAAREAWSRGLLLAEEMPLGELLAELGRYRRGHLGVAPEVAHLRVLGGYPLQDPDRALAMLAQVLPIQVYRPLPWWTSVERLEQGR